MSDLSPTARALRTMEILQARPHTTAAELAAGLGVTERAARRYVGILREAGITVESVRGPYGGYRLGRGTRLPPVLFTLPEAFGLVMVVLEGQSAIADGEDTVGVALGKVIRALPEGIGRQVAVLREHASTTSSRYSTHPEPAITATLVTAIANRRPVRITYRSTPEREWSGEVDPWAVVIRFGRWYLLCHSHRADAIRTYRIDRMATAEPVDGTFEPPEGLDPLAVVEENLSSGWPFAARVRFDAPREQVAPWVHAAMGRLEPDGGGCLLTGTTNNPAMYAQEWLARMPFAYRVDGGPELRAATEALMTRLRAALAEDA